MRVEKMLRGGFAGLLIAAVATIIEPVLVFGKDSPEAGFTGDKRAVQFFLPGQFEEALQWSKTRRRCLLVKGVAGGMDKIGAKQCTKGHW